MKFLSLKYLAKSNFPLHFLSNVNVVGLQKRLLYITLTSFCGVIKLSLIRSEETYLPSQLICGLILFIYFNKQKGDTARQNI